MYRTVIELKKDVEENTLRQLKRGRADVFLD